MTFDRRGRLTCDDVSVFEDGCLTKSFFKGPSIQLQQQQRTSPSLLHDWHKDDLRCMEGDVDAAAAGDQRRDGRLIFAFTSMKNCVVLN